MCTFHKNTNVVAAAITTSLPLLLLIVINGRVPIEISTSSQER